MRMGIPKVLTTDQGSEFKNRLNEDIMQLLKIRHHLTTAYHPQVQHIILIASLPCMPFKIQALDFMLFHENCIPIVVIARSSVKKKIACRLHSAFAKN